MWALIGLQLVASPITDSHAWIVRIYPDRLACVKAADEISVDKMRKYHCQEHKNEERTVHVWWRELWENPGTTVRAAGIIVAVVGGTGGAIGAIGRWYGVF
jgi:hypothetical protein